MQKQLIIGILMAIAPSTLGANASDSVRTMTLKECMEYAVSNSTKTRISQANVGDAQIARRDAILSVLTPSVSAGASAGYNFGRNIDPQTNTYFNTTSFSNSYSINAGIDLFNGFSAVNNMRISKTALAISKSEQEQTEADICLAVMEAYYNVVYYSRLCQLFEEQVVTAKASLAKMRRQEEIGQKSRADVIQLEADLADREYDLANTRQIYSEQMMTLSDLMFFPMDEQLVVDTVVPEPTINLQSEDEIVSFALGNDPAVRIAGMKAENARLELSTARWKLLPSLYASAGLSTGYNSVDDNSFKTQLRNHVGESVGLSLSIPIFNRLQGHSEVSKKKNSYVRATAELEQKNRETESAVRKAYSDCNTAMATYVQSCKKTEIQQEAYQLNLKRMEQGLISGLEYQTAVNNYLKAKSDNMNSLFKYLIKQSVLKYYSGIDYVNQ
ncbi:MAG: TolC family protein [Salinivirgaceae bacterium]|nr:TolC family protein [Salinivirgaceae bacterium]